LTDVNTLCKYIKAIHLESREERINARCHEIAFQDAARIFHGPVVERVDDRFDYGEVRVYAISVVNGIEITVIYTDRDKEERHLISAWRSEPHERRYYWQNLEGKDG
jgi:uncharacterized protein